jgi:flagellar basal-body rod modification protein FlgD
MQSASLIGRSVLVPGEQIQLTGAEVNELNIELPQGAQRLQMNILDASGNTVRRLDATSVAPGTLQLAWDGRGDAGQLLPAGSYQVQAVASNEAGGLPATVLVPGRVASVAQASASNGSGIWLDLDGGQRIKLADVRLIS